MTDTLNAPAQPQWSPGSWHACRGGDCSCKAVWCDDHPVAEVTHGDWGDDYPSIRLIGSSSLDLKAEAYMDQITYGAVDDATATANARLIAQAPDMAAYIQARANDGDADALAIMDRVRNGVRIDWDKHPSAPVAQGDRAAAF